MKKVPIKKQIYDVISEDEYARRVKLNPSITKELANETAIERDGYVYPLNSVSSPDVVGVANEGIALRYSKPKTEEEKKIYSKDNIIDFDNTSNLREMIEKQAKLERAEKNILLSTGNIYTPLTKEEDTPEFALLKNAIRKKQIDIEAYKPRFGSDFSNNLRLVSTGNSITFNKLKTIASALDIEAELILRDKKGAANPIGQELHTILNQ